MSRFLPAQSEIEGSDDLRTPRDTQYCQIKSFLTADGQDEHR